MNSTPAGLLAVRDLIERHPKDRERILQYEVAHRERERQLYLGTRKLMRFHLWASAKTLVTLGLSVFALIWTVGQVAQIAQWFQQVRGLTFKIPVPLRQDIVWRISDYLPTSTVFEVASKIPVFDWRDAGYIALAVMVLVLVEKLIVTILTWKHSQGLQGGITTAEEEIRFLKEWMEEGRVRGQSK